MQLRCGRVLGLCAAGTGSGKREDLLTAEERRLRGSAIESAREAVRRALRLAPAMAFEILSEPDLEFLRRRGVLEAVARELGRPEAAVAAKG